MIKKKEGSNNDSNKDSSFAIGDEGCSFLLNGIKNHTNQTNNINHCVNQEYLNEKCEKPEELESPFPSDETTDESNFNEENVRKQLMSIMPEKDHYLINHIINDKKYYYSNNLTIEKGLFRDNNSNFLGVFDGEKKNFNIPSHIMRIAKNNGLSIMSHNHINGLVIPSQKDIFAFVSHKSNYSLLYSPNKIGLLVNNYSIKNKKSRYEIFNRYDKFMKDKEISIQKLYPEKTKILKEKYNKDKLRNKLENDLYRPYFTKNQENIAKEINSMFKENSFDLKLYIL